MTNDNVPQNLETNIFSIIKNRKRKKLLGKSFIYFVSVCLVLIIDGMTNLAVSSGSEDFDVKKLYTNEKDRLKLLSDSSINIVNSFPTPTSESRGIAWGIDCLWISTDHISRIRKLDPNDGSVLFTGDAPSPIQPNDIIQGLVWDGSHLWVNTYYNSNLYKIDVDSWTVEKIIPLPIGSFGLTWDGQYFYSLHYVYSILVIDPDSGTIVDEIPQEDDYWGIAWRDNFLWVPQLNPTGNMLKLRISDGIAVDSVPIDFVDWPLGLTWTGQYFWLLDLDGEMIYQLELVENVPELTSRGFVVFIIFFTGVICLMSKKSHTYSSQT